MRAPRTLQDLLDIEAIKQLKSDYFHFMDTKQWDSWRELFTDDFVAQGREPIRQGRDQFVRFVSEKLDGVSSCHHGYMPVIEILSKSTARGRWTMDDELRLPAGHPWSAPGTTGGSRLLGYGFYDEEYRKTGSDWQIAVMKLSRLRVWTSSDV